MLYFVVTGLSPKVHVKNLICDKKQGVLLGFTIPSEFNGLIEWAFIHVQLCEFVMLTLVSTSLMESLGL